MTGESISDATDYQRSLFAANPPTCPPPSVYPHQCLGVGVGLFVHDDLCHLVMPTVGGHVQRRQVVIGHVVHGHLVVQQQLDAVEVVALRRHVEGRQTVLEGTQESFVNVRSHMCLVGMFLSKTMDYFSLCKSICKNRQGRVRGKHRGRQFREGEKETRGKMKIEDRRDDRRCETRR